MGGAAPIPGSTQSFQAYTPNALDWQKQQWQQAMEAAMLNMQAQNFWLQAEKHGLQMAYYQPMLQDALAKRNLFKGVMKGDTESLGKFAGMPQGTSNEEIMRAVNTRIGKKPQQTAAAGGIMQLKGYATGGNTKKTTKAKKATAQPTVTSPLETIAPTGVGTSGILPTMAPTPAPAGSALPTITPNPTSPRDLPPTITPTPAATVAPPGDQKEPVKQQLPFSAMDANTYMPHGVELGRNDQGVVDPLAPIKFTDPNVIKAFEYLGQMKAPDEWGQAGQMYNDVYSGLAGLTNFRPDTISAQQAAAQQAAAQQASAQQASAAQMGAIGDVNAERVNLGQFNVNASQMQRPEDVAAREIQAERILGAQMQRPEDVQAQAMQRYQMDSTAPISTKDLEAYQMAGPGSWTDAGVADKYMSPYMQGVIDIAKRETERDYTKQMNALAAKAKSAGAFGGARQALERSEAQRNFNQQLQDIQTKGLQSAYESGRSQYGQELGLSQQAALQNLQSKLSTQSQSSQQALQAMLANQNIDYQTKLQNLQAMLGVQSQEAQQMLNASLANQQTALTTNQQNLQAEMQKQLANQQSSMTAQQANQQALLQAALANQQSGLTVGQVNAQLAQQAALANQGIGAQGALANQDAALRAALANQQTQFGVGSLNANLANQVALQNASLGTQASLTNANLGTQAALQNAQLGTQTSWQNAQNALQASMANQQAGIAGAQLNLGAYNAQGNMAQGLGAIGNQQAGWQQNMLGNYTNAANYSMNAGNAALEGWRKTNEAAYNNSNLQQQPIA